MARLAWGPLTTIRFRLAAAVAVALLPVLALGAIQASIAFRKDTDQERANLALAAARSASTARAQLAAAGVLLETLAPQSVGLECAQRLSETSQRLGGYLNLVRYDSGGQVACSAGTASAADPSSDWF